MDYLSLVNMGPEESYPVDRSRSIFDLMDERKFISLTKVRKLVALSLAACLNWLSVSRQYGVLELGELVRAVAG